MTQVSPLDRREALKGLAAGLGATLIPGVARALQAGVDPAAAPQGVPALSIAARRELVTLLSERILPQTDTPGAIDAGVPQFIDLMLTDFYDADYRQRFLKGLDRVAQSSKNRFGTRLSALHEQDIDRLLAAMEAGDLSAEDRTFFEELKQLVVLGYYSSEVGLTQEREYVPVPGRYDGAFPYSPGDKLYV